MKKHLLGFAIFSLIVSGFVTVWAVFGYLTQPIPVVPKVESDKLPVFKSENRKSCNMKREKISFIVESSNYFADSHVLISTLRFRWNGYGTPPEKLNITPKIFTADNKIISYSGEQSQKVSFSQSRREILVTVSSKLSLDHNQLKENIYCDFSVSDNFGNVISSPNILESNQIVVNHGEVSIITR